MTEQLSQPQPPQALGHLKLSGALLAPAVAVWGDASAGGRVGGDGVLCSPGYRGCPTAGRCGLCLSTG